jgi:O-antigen/teichoic acid export membrane protein
MRMSSRDPGAGGHIGGFLRGAGLLIAGTVGGQAILLLASPILTRLYTPDDFGVFGLYVSVFAFFNIVSSGRYELAIPLARRDEFALNVLVLCMALIGGFTLLSVVLLQTGLPDLLGAIGIDLTPAVIALLPFGIAASGLYKVQSFWTLRVSAYRTAALARLLQGIGVTVTQLALGVAALSHAGLILGHVAGFLASYLTVLWLMLTLPRRLLKQISWARIRLAARRFIRFPLFSIWSDFFNVFGTQLPIFVMVSLFSPAVAGLYFLAIRVANAPVAIVAEATTKTLISIGSKPSLRAELAGFSLSVFKSLARISLVPMLCALPLGPALFGSIFGPDWAVAGLYFSYLVPWTLTVFMFVPLMALFSILERQKLELGFQALIFTARSIGILLGALSGSVDMALVLFSGAATISYLVTGVAALRMVGNPLTGIAAAFGAELVIGLAAMIGVFGVQSAMSPGWGLATGLTLAVPLSGWAVLSGLRGFKRSMKDRTGQVDRKSLERPILSMRSGRRI